MNEAGVPAALVADSVRTNRHHLESALVKEVDRPTSVNPSMHTLHRDATLSTAISSFPRCTLPEWVISVIDGALDHGNIHPARRKQCG